MNQKYMKTEYLHTVIDLAEHSIIFKIQKKNQKIHLRLQCELNDVML